MRRTPWVTVMDVHTDRMRTPVLDVFAHIVPFTGWPRGDTRACVLKHCERGVSPASVTAWSFLVVDMNVACLQILTRYEGL
jgi:hypothetical protein